MPRRAAVVSIQELRRQLAAKERRVDGLLARRKKLAARLETIDAEVVALGGEIPSKRGRKRRKAAGRPGRKPGRAPGKKKLRGRATGRPLVQYVVDVLKKAGGGMRVKDVMAAVTKAGYKSLSHDFYGIVAAALRDATKFKKLRRGVYTLV